MLAWFLKLIGSDEEFHTHVDDVQLLLQNPILFWLGAVLIIPLGFWIYRRQRANLTSVPRVLCIGLTATRLGVLFLLIVVLAGPYARIKKKVEKRPIVAVLLDHSESMRLPASPFANEAETLRVGRAAGYPLVNDQLDAANRQALLRVSRASLAQTVLQANSQALLEPVAKKYDLKFYSFARTMRMLGVDPLKPELPDPPNPGGPSTHVGDALAQILDEAAGRGIAGMILFSDGQNTGGRSPNEVGRLAADAKAPVFAVPVGPTVRLRDVAVVDVFTSGLVSVGDQARVSVTIESQGFDSRPVQVQLLDGEKLLDTKELTLRGSEQQQLDLTFKATEAGAKYLTVKVPPLPEEPEYLLRNNVDVAFVRISDEKSRVLYVEGTPHWDFRFLKNAMRRDHGLGGRDRDQPDILVETELRRRAPAAKGTNIPTLPTTLEEFAKYHTIILGDVSPQLWTEEMVRLLDDAVRERGVGLIVVAGTLNMPHRFDGRMRDLLPIVMRSNATPLEAPVFKPFRLEITPDGTVHESMRLYDDADRNANVWSNMPPFFLSAALDRPAPGATVLATNAGLDGRFGKAPLIAYHYAGKGKVLFVGMNSTWLWRQNVGDRFFYKFWGQALRFVARRDEADAKKSWLEARPVRAQPGEPARVDLLAVDNEGAPIESPKIPVRLLGPDEPRTLELSADPNNKGRYSGSFTPQSEGEYRLVYDSAQGEVEAQLRVMVAPEELRQPNLNRASLEILAKNTDGAVVELDDLASIPAKLQGEATLAPLDRSAPIWDNWLTFSLLCLLYSVDVGIRKLSGLA